MRAKILGVVIAVVCLLGIAVLLQLRASLRLELGEGLRNRGTTIARDVAARAVDLLLTERIFELHRLLHETQRHDTDVRYVFVLDERQHVVAHTFGRGVPGGLIELNAPRPDGEPGIRLIGSDEGLLTDVAVSILDGRKGVVRLGVSHQSVDTAIRRASLRLLATIAACLVVGLGIALGLTSVLTRPIVELVRAARSVESGNTTARARVFAPDEIGELAVAFNSMTESIIRAHTNLQKRVDELHALAATASAFAGEHELSAALGGALDAVMPGVHATAGWVLLLSDGAPPWRLVAHRGLASAPEGPIEVESLSGCPCERATTDGEPVVDVARGPCRCLSEALNPPDATLACVSLLAEDRLVGVLYLALPPRHVLSDEERALLATVGRHIGTSVDNVRLSTLAKAREHRRGQILEDVINAQEAERKRVARDLHDEAGQVLTTLMLRLRTLEEHGRLDADARRDVADAKDLAHHLFDELHRVASELRPSPLDRYGLAEAVRAMADDVGRGAGLSIEVDTEAFDCNGIPGHRLTAIYRIVQEALNNVSKHACATHVSVLLACDGSSVSAVIEDNGHGFDTSTMLDGLREGRRSLGLFGMQERADILGGRVTIESTPGSGTTVFVEAPVGTDT